MNFRIPTWPTILLISAVVTVLAVILPFLAVNIVLWEVPIEAKLPDLIVTVAIPLFIAGPITAFALYIVRTLYMTVDRLDQLVRLDAMTGLVSRTHFMSHAEEFRREGGFLILADADKFKSINDTLGHEAGDEALRHMATEMQRTFGPHGIVARMGGEEFGIYLPDMARKEAELLVAALGTRLRNNGFRYREHELAPTVSFGIVPTGNKLSAACLLSKADEALYTAKRNGRDRYVFIETLDEKAPVAA